MPNLIDLNLAHRTRDDHRFEYTEDGQVRNVTAPSPTITDVSTDTTLETDRLCAACRHRRDAHDTIGARFCAATIANGTVRGCVCVSDATTSGAQVTG